MSLCRYALVGVFGMIGNTLMNEPYDWADDDSLSAEETMRIFESLGPEDTLWVDKIHDYVWEE